MHGALDRRKWSVRRGEIHSQNSKRNEEPPLNAPEGASDISRCRLAITLPLSKSCFLIRELGAHRLELPHLQIQDKLIPSPRSPSPSWNASPFWTALERERNEIGIKLMRKCYCRSGEFDRIIPVTARVGWIRHSEDHSLSSTKRKKGKNGEGLCGA